MPGIMRYLDEPGFHLHGKFGFREFPTEEDTDLLNGEFVAFVEDHDFDAASEICTRLEAGERIVPLPRRDLYKLAETRRRQTARRSKAAGRASTRRGR